MADTELATISQASAMMLMPAYRIEDALERRDKLTEFVKKIMVRGTDYGDIPGTGKGGEKGKDVLLKPGAEKLVSFFGLTPRFEITADEDWTGERHKGEAKLAYISKCQLWYGDRLIGEGNGACNSWETKYRYRNAERICPSCGVDAIKVSKFPPDDSPHEQPGFYCYGKAGGCGAKFRFDDARIANQETGKKANPDIADVQNTLIKMADKRSLIAACLIGVNASEYFTQDVEDNPAIEAEYRDDKPTQPQQPRSQQARPPAPQNGNNGTARPTPSDLLLDEIDGIAMTKFGPSEEGGAGRFVAFLGSAGIESIDEYNALTNITKLKALRADLQALPNYGEPVAA